MGSYRVMVRSRNYVAAFIKSFYKRNDMSMLELTPDFIKEFSVFLTTEQGLKNASVRKGFQVVKDPKDKSKLVLAINGQQISEWFKEQFNKLPSSIRKTVTPLTKSKRLEL